MGYEPPTHRYTVEELARLVDETIELCNRGELQPDPAALRIHTGLSKQVIYSYRTLEQHQAYKPIIDRYYDFLEQEATKDNKTGYGRYAAHINNRVLKYSEVQKIDQKTEMSGKVDVNVQIQQAIDKANEQ